MTHRPLVSVVMPVHNSEGFVAEALESILAQTFPDFELIAINDGSYDQTGSILDSYRARDRRLNVIHTSHQGLVGALNAGLSLASGELVARQDADDVSVCERLQLQVDFLRTHPSVAALGGWLRTVGPKGHSDIGYPSGNHAIKNALLSYCAMAHPTVMLRSSAIRDVGLYRKQFRHAEDHDLWLRLAERFELENLPVPLVIHRLHEGQVSHTKVRQQVVSSLGAIACAESRRRTSRDPADEIDLMTESFLEGLGVSRQHVQTQVVRGLVLRAQLTVDGGDIALARGVIDAIRSEMLADIGDSKSTGYIYWRIGKLGLRVGRLLEGAWWLLRAVMHDPGLLLNFLRLRARRWCRASLWEKGDSCQ
jgi:hypothetical protein